MKDKHWAVFALRDIRNALDNDRYDVATCHINDAIAAILACDGREFSRVMRIDQEEDESFGPRM